MALHGSIKRWPQKGRAILQARRKGDEALCADELELVADGLIEEDLGAHGIGNRPHECPVQKVDSHASAGFILHTHDRRKVAVTEGDDDILVLLQRFADVGPLLRRCWIGGLGPRAWTRPKAASQ